jgi:hypothetical protein
MVSNGLQQSARRAHNQGGPGSSPGGTTWNQNITGQKPLNQVFRGFFFSPKIHLYVFKECLRGID